VVGKLIIGVDLGGTQIRVALADGEGRLLLVLATLGNNVGLLDAVALALFQEDYSALGKM